MINNQRLKRRMLPARSSLANAQFPTATALIFFDVTAFTEAESCLNDLKVMKPKPAQQTVNNARDVQLFVPIFDTG